MTDSTVGAPAPLLLPDAPRRRAENSLAALFEHSLIQCKRLLMVWAHDMPTAVQALIYPALTVVMLNIVFGDLVSRTGGAPSIYGQTAMVTLIAAISGSLISAIGLRTDAQLGLLARFATMPIHRAAGIVGRLMAETIRIVLTTAGIVAVGALLGFRFDQGPLAVVGFFCVPVLFGMAFAMLVTFLATLPGRAPLIEIVSLVMTLLMFFNTGFVPLFAYPLWLQDVVANQPMSCAVDAMKGLSLGAPVAESITKTALWAVGTILVLAYPTIRGYRRIAVTGP